MQIIEIKHFDMNIYIQINIKLFNTYLICLKKLFIKIIQL